LFSEDKQRCPGCGSLDTRHSFRGGLLDSLMRAFRKRPFRCRSCRQRFYRRETEIPDSELPAEEPIDQEAG
jgi:hypothetical protein